MRGNQLAANWKQGPEMAELKIEMQVRNLFQPKTGKK